MERERIPGIGEEVQRDIFPEQSVAFDGSRTRAPTSDIAYPSDRAFVESILRNRVYGGFVLGGIGLVFGATFAYFGALSGAADLLLSGVLCLVLGVLFLLYAFALGLGWIRPRWWL